MTMDDNLQQIGLFLARKPEYNALVREMYPVDKIQKENDMILSAAAKARYNNEHFNTSRVVLIGRGHKGWTAKKK